MQSEVLCVSTNAAGDLLCSGGRDGRVNVWVWGADQFLHQRASLFVTNLPILACAFLSASEVAISLDLHIMGLRIARKDMQHYSLEQVGSKHYKMAAGNGNVGRPANLARLLRFGSNEKTLYLGLRSRSRMLEVIGPQDIDVTLDESEVDPAEVLAFDHVLAEDVADRGPLIATGIVKTRGGEPFLEMWLKERGRD